MHKIEDRAIAKKELCEMGVDDIDATAPNTQDSIDTTLKTKTLSTMHKKSGNVEVEFGKTSKDNYLAETTPNKGYTKATGIVVNQSKIFSYFKLYQTLGHELTHAIDYYTGGALTKFKEFYKQNKSTAQGRFEKWLEYRAYDWEVRNAPDYWSSIYRHKYKKY